MAGEKQAPVIVSILTNRLLVIILQECKDKNENRKIPLRNASRKTSGRVKTYFPSTP